MKDLQRGFTCDPIKIVGQVIVPIRSTGRTYETTIFFITEAHERNILGNDNLPNVGIKVAQKRFPQSRTTLAVSLLLIPSDYIKVKQKPFSRNSTNYLTESVI